MQGALVDGEAAEAVQRVAADDEGRGILELGVLLPDVEQVPEGLVLRRQLVIVHQLVPQLLVLLLELLVLGDDLVDAHVFVQQAVQPAAEQLGRFLDWGEQRAHDLLGGVGQPAVGAGPGHHARQHHRHRQQDLEFFGVEKVAHGQNSLRPGPAGAFNSKAGGERTPPAHSFSALRRFFRGDQKWLESSSSTSLRMSR